MKFSTFHLFHRFPGQSVKEVYDHHAELIELAEELGFHGARVAEHHFRDYGTVPSGLAFLAHMAGRTERLRLGTGIVVLPLYNPVHVAEQAAMVDVLSGGRLDLGVGRGYQSYEFDGFGVDLSQARARFDEALETVLALWGGEPVRRDGAFSSVAPGLEEGVALMPRPLQSPRPPVHVAAVSPETVERYAARGLPILADPAAPFSRVARAAEAWRSTAAAHGHDPDAAELVVGRSVYVAPSAGQAREDLERFEASFDRTRIFNERSAPLDRRTGEVAQGFEYWQNRYMKGAEVGTDDRWERLEVVGGPERVVGQVRALQEMGFGHLLCDFGSTRRMPLEEMKKVLKFFAAEVMPAFA
ncbi:LLM class flavin-dependent oxidoreductase [Nocardiopsis chromatogenes]|uniref:LLM class flavin-dependent oxidoreductase n=1 Tax=Nocardiopsis chromatogenes TaxID=280239 RepID=UPI00034892B0|nr:LLM class flavin-dependent oxidoreductase [Nocardiopsis chromatogenes]